jgi:uncharacterized membrane protein YhdT
MGSWTLSLWTAVRAFPLTLAYLAAWTVVLYWVASTGRV